MHQTSAAHVLLRYLVHNSLYFELERYLMHDAFVSGLVDCLLFPSVRYGMENICFLP